MKLPELELKFMLFFIVDRFKIAKLIMAIFDDIYYLPLFIPMKHFADLLLNKIIPKLMIKFLSYRGEENRNKVST